MDMKREVFLSTGEKDIYGFELDALKSYLTERSLIVDSIVTHGKNCIHITLENDNSEIIDILIKTINAKIINIIENDPNKSWSYTKKVKQSLESFSDITDVTQETLSKISDAQEILKSLFLPLEDIPFYAGKLSIKQENNNYIVSLQSDKSYIHDEDKYSIQFQWIFSFDTNDFQTRTTILKNGKKESDNEHFRWKNTKEANMEASSLGKIDIFEILKYVKVKSEKIPEDIAFVQKENLQEKPEKQEDDDSLPIDTIIQTDSVPSWSIVEKLRFSSLDKILKQLEQWNIPYQIIRFSRWKQILHSLKEVSEEEVKIALSLQIWENSHQQHYIVCRTGEIMFSYPRSNEGEFIFAGTFGTDDSWGIIFSPLKNNGWYTQKVSIWEPEEKEVIQSSKAIIIIDNHMAKLVQDSLEIEWYSFPLTEEQKAKFKSFEYTSIFDKESGVQWGTVLSKFIEIHFEFPIGHTEPVLKDIKTIIHRDNYKV